jgi:hypothetical protein
MESKIRGKENLHIYLWLIKDLSWLLGYKWLGTTMIVPTLLLAVYISYITRKNPVQFWPNLAVCSWISANVIWMLGEFYAFHYKPYSAIFFISGLLLMGVYFYKYMLDKYGWAKKW